MDPTHFLAARPRSNGRTQREIEAFYEQHGRDAFALFRTIRRIALRIRQFPKSGPKIAVAHPAE
jgi:hypothetical protein